MPAANIDQLTEAIEQRVIVRRDNLANRLSRLRVVVPVLEWRTNDDGQGVLIWSPRNVNLSDPLDSCFAEFITLVDAPTEDIIRFAKRFGPLHRPVPSASRVSREEQGEEADGPPSDSFSEPIWAWRMYARGLRALMNVTEVASRGAVTGSDDLIWAFATVAVPQWLDNAASADPPLTELDALSLAVEHLLSDDMVERIVTTALESAGVGPAFPARKQSEELGYSLPLRKLYPADGTQVQVTWGPPSLLPVLAISLAFALIPEEPTICTWCKKPAGVVRRRPRKGHPWFGDHTRCRALARVETVVRVEEKRAAKRRARKAEGQE
jgi:hypothetical protein